MSAEGKYLQQTAENKLQRISLLSLGDPAGQSLCKTEVFQQPARGLAPIIPDGSIDQGPRARVQLSGGVHRAIAEVLLDRKQPGTLAGQSR